MDENWMMKIFPIMAIICLLLLVGFQNGTSSNTVVVSITHMGCGVGNVSIEEIMAERQNNTADTSSAPDLIFQNIEPQTLIVPEGNTLNGTDHTSPKELREEPKSENVMLLFASLIPIIGLPLLSNINDKHRSLILRAETLSR